MPLEYVNPNGRHMASVEAVHRRRANRRFRKVRFSPAGIVRPVEETKLTRRQQHTLGRYTVGLIEVGQVQLRYMGVLFLELLSLGWTPHNGIKCTAEEFDEVWGWWGSVPANDRAEVIELSRESGIELVKKA